MVELTLETEMNFANMQRNDLWVLDNKEFLVANLLSGLNSGIQLVLKRNCRILQITPCTTDGHCDSVVRFWVSLEPLQNVQ